MTDAIAPVLGEEYFFLTQFCERAQVQVVGCPWDIQ